MLSILRLFSIWSKLERWKTSINGYLVSCPKIKKLFWSAVFFYSTQQHWTTSWSDYDMQHKVNFIWQPAMTSSIVGPRRSSRALPKAKKSEKKSEVTQSCLTLCDLMDCSLPSSSIHGIFQARVPEWVAISFSRGSSRLRDQTRVSRIAGRWVTIWATREAPQKPK